MVLNLTLPQIGEMMTQAVIDAIYAVEGGFLTLGAKLLDLTVDLSDSAAHDCPPVAHYRIALRDRVWLRRLAVEPGDQPGVGAALALFSTEPDETLGEPVRPVRVTIAGIIRQSVWGEAPP